jgi:hypothetical protein
MAPIGGRTDPICSESVVMPLRGHPPGRDKAKPQKVALKRDIAARLLMDGVDTCEDLREWYPEISERAFRRYLRAEQFSMWSGSPAPQASADNLVLGGPLCPVPSTPVAGHRLSVQMISDAHHEAWSDAMWARDQGLNADGTVKNATWLEVSFSTRNAVMKFDIRAAVEFYGEREAELGCFLAAIEAHSPSLGERCREWIETFEATHWNAAPFAHTAEKLEEAYLDAELTRPIKLGGRGRRCTPAAVIKSVNFRLRWIRGALKVLALYWNDKGQGSFWQSLADWALTLEPESTLAIMRAMTSAMASAKAKAKAAAKAARTRAAVAKAARAEANDEGAQSQVRA